MLLALSIRDFVIVDALDLEFGAGFAALTGETGAGKSILIDALLLALGERADAQVVRDGAARAEVCAEFAADPATRAWLQAADLAADGPTVVLRRLVDASGRSRAFINGTPVALAQLRALGETLVDVHGQHAHQSLLRPSAQLQLLDELGGLTAQAAQLALLFGHWRAARQALEQAQTMAGATEREQERLRWIVEELEELAPQDGEWDAAQTEHQRLAHAASLLEAATATVDQLSQEDASALARIDAASTRLGSLAAFDARLKPALELLAAARIQVDEAAHELGGYLAHTEVDDARLAELDARLARFHAAARKFRCRPEELAARLAQTRAQLGALAAAADLDALLARARAAWDVYLDAARALTEARTGTAAAMGREVTRAMQDLSMAGGRFEVQLTALAPEQATAHGLERVEFLVAGHAAVAARPLARIASGGELSRISLAISVIAATANPVATLIFDEVDAGIGGAVAETVGRLLKQLGQNRQVLCVTHLPQVAARADGHWVVSKVSADDGRPVSRLTALERSGRVEELARMLGGIEITDTTRRHAREMLAG